ncbi:amidohydrolase family protein [Actinoplanes sp. NPDC023714]|uniref:amidohydrolase family protein n=1 Tax=Actinoplanes sp. NPDC023714 TaxID=3154322 RepID=UPI0033E3396B
MIVDAHHHLWRPEAGYAWLDAPGLAPIRRPFLPADLTPELRAAGVGATVLVEGGRCHPSETAEFLRYADETPEIAGVVGWVDVTDPGPLPRSPHLVGVRAQVQAEPDPDHLDRPDVRRGLAAIADAGLVFDLVIREDQLPAAARAAQAIPGLRFVLDHLGKPRTFAGWRGPFADLAANPNVTCKLSGLVTEIGPSWTVEALRPYIATAVEVFGPSRLMFGSDWPVCLLVARYGEVLTALREALPPLPAAALDEIFGGTAIRVYGLS